LTTALDRREWSASRPERFTHIGSGPGTHSVGGWMGPRTGLDAAEKGEISGPCRRSNPDRPARNSPLDRLSYPAYTSSNQSILNLNRNIAVIKTSKPPAIIPTRLNA
jgi:hypothetical protein